MGVTICIVNIHGYFYKFEHLWINIEHHVVSYAFIKSTIIFLGDYYNQGSDISKGHNFLFPHKHIFLCDNNDFAFVDFMKLLLPPLEGFSLENTWKELQKSEEREGWFTREGY
eukprot:Gb_08597 [translate_table: standard]